MALETSKTFATFSRAGVILLAAAAAALALPGCATVTRGKAVPDELQSVANVIGFPAGIRYFPRDAGHVEEFERDFLDSNERERAHLHVEKGRPLPPAAYLAISGGGDNGAFGAGFLNGWTKAGTRPQFKLVTGVSTGALIAPFAFLGPAYDDKLKSLYTGVSLQDIAQKRSLLSVLYGDAMADTTPLRRLVEKYVTQDLVAAIAAEHEKGRILLVATTNLDVRRAVIWNITEIAATRAAGKLDLIRKILIASAAIPGTFPPVMIDVEAEGQKYQEMHVDGGTAAQVFVYPAAIQLSALAERDRTVYIIRNARLDPEWAETDRRTLPIALRAITCLLQNQGLGDLYRIFAITQRDKVDFNLVYIPRSFQVPHTTDFDTAYMKALFDTAFLMAEQAHPWEKHPPVLVSGVDQARGR